MTSDHLLVTSGLITWLTGFLGVSKIILICRAGKMTWPDGLGWARRLQIGSGWALKKVAQIEMSHFSLARLAWWTKWAHARLIRSMKKINANQTDPINEKNILWYRFKIFLIILGTLFVLESSLPGMLQFLSTQAYSRFLEECKKQTWR